MQSCNNILVFRAVLALALTLVTPTVWADGFQTTLHLRPPVFNTDSIDTVIYRWSTNISTGMIGADDLVDLSMELISNGVRVYRDEIVVDGVLQPFGGTTRLEEDDLFWSFDLDMLTLIQIHNASYITAGNSAGTQYRVADGLSFPDDDEVHLDRYTGGFVDAGTVEVLESQNTIGVLVFADGFETGDVSAW